MSEVMTAAHTRRHALRVPEVVKAAQTRRHALRVPVDELTIPVDELLRHFEHINTVSNSEVSVRQDLDIGIQIPLSASWTQPVFWPAPSIYDLLADLLA